MDYYEDSFRYFQLRKILRMAGGERSDNKANPTLTTVVVILWFLNFFVYSVSFGGHQLTFKFYDWTPSGVKDTSALWIASATFVISFVMTMTSVIWQKRCLLWYCFGYMIAAFIISIVFRNLSHGGWKTRKIILIVEAIVAAVMSAVVINYVWSYVFIPATVKYKYSDTINKKSCIQSSFSFPYPQTILMLFYVIIVIPLWLPFLTLLVMLAVLSAIGFPIDPLFSIAEPCKLSMGYWIFIPRSYKVHYSSDPAYFMRLFTCNHVTASALVTISSVEYHFEYCGERDESGRPHGYGEWRDSDPDGEVYRGYWLDGIPVGPGKSRESRMGGVFAVVRVGYCCCVAGHVDKKNIRSEWRRAESDETGASSTTAGPPVCPHAVGELNEVSPRRYSWDHSSGGEGVSSTAAEIGSPSPDTGSTTSATTLPGECIRIRPVEGIASVDCSIAGTFFKGFPYVSYFTEPSSFGDIFESLHPHHTPLQLPPHLPFTSSEIEMRNDEEMKAPGPYAGDGPTHVLDGSSPGQGREGRCVGGLQENDIEACQIETREKYVAGTARSGGGGNDSGGNVRVSSADNESMRDELFQRQFPRAVSFHSQLCAEKKSGQVLHHHRLLTNGPVVNEALIFIPGFNSCLNTCIGVFGQFCTLSALPLYLSPWVFQWPGGSVYSYYEAKQAAESDTFWHQLDRLIHNLYLQGIQRVNFMCHSMGARGFMSFIEHTTSLKPLTPSAASIAHSSRTHLHASSGKGELLHLDDNANPRGGPCVGNIILINPEADLHRFTDISFPCMRAYTNSTTIYVDQNDVAIYWAEKANAAQQAQCGYVLSSCDGIMGICGVGLCSCCCNTCTGLVQGTANPSHDVESTHNGSIVAGSYPTSLGRILQTGHAGAITAMVLASDPDIIDATNIHGNEKDIRHSYFSLSREVIEDVRELLVYRKSAEQRTARLVRREGSYVFDFLVAPAFVKS